MKSKIILMFFALSILWGCETQTFQYVSTITKGLDYDINQQGQFSEVYTIYASEINEELELPEDAQIVDVYVEALSVAVEHLTGNEASAVSMDGYVGGTQFVNDLVINITPGTYEYTAMANLVANGIKTMSDDLEGFVVASDPPSMVFSINGDSHPAAGQVLRMRILIDVTITVIYSLETEFPDF